MGSIDTTTPSSQRVETGSVNIPLGSWPATSQKSSVDAEQVANNIVSRFNEALSQGTHDGVSNLFLEENSYWRDHLALSWSLRTLHGRAKIKDYLNASENTLSGITIDSNTEFKKPHFGPIDGLGNVNGIVFFITLETSIGRGQGVINLAEENPDNWKIFTLYTVMSELKGHEEPTRHRRTQGVQHGDLSTRKNWQERRDTEQQEPEPKVLIIGAGQGGLTVAARLKMLDVPSLIVDQNERVGDNWRKRYKQLVLHDPVWYDHMPYLPFPAHWPIFTPKDKLGEWFEGYVKFLELNVWMNTRITDSSWHEESKTWSVTIERRKQGGEVETKVLRPKHIIQATGHSGKPNLPAIPGMQDFKGDNICHSSSHPGANPESKGKKAVVIGCCNSAHDIAQDFFEKGYDITMLQRSSTCVVSSSAILNIGLKNLYDEDAPALDDVDVYVWSIPSPLWKATQIKVTAKQAEHDEKTLTGLEKAGFKLDRGPMDAGLTAKYFQRGGGYYIDVGASQLIIDGKIKVVQGREVSAVLPHGLQLSDGTELAADEVVFATGYQNMRTHTRDILGDQVADKVSDVWGFNEEGEFRTMWQRSGHERLWFMGGNLALCRYYSRILALQIKGIEEGLCDGATRRQ